MTLEYVLLLAVSSALFLGSLSVGNGPIAMMRNSGPKLAVRLERDLITGRGFFETHVPSHYELIWEK